MGDRLVERLGPGGAVPGGAVHRHGGTLGLLHIRERYVVWCSGQSCRRHDRLDRQVELLGELVVALVMRWHRHDRTRAVPGEHIVGDPHRNLLAVHRINGKRACGNAALLFGGGEAVDFGLALRCFDVGGNRSALLWRGDGVDELMLRCEHHEGCAVERVGTRGEDAQLLAAGVVCRGRNGEVDLGTFRAPNPIRLHCADRLWPGQPFKREELVGVIGNLEEPLRQVALGDLGRAAPTDAINSFDLFAREGHLARGAPVDRRLLAIGDTLLVELQEDPLVPAEVDRVTGDDLCVPVE